ncbi:MAG TPA: bifunctional phosphopantothenoylcysteine decarboxylase/phosphopantothenate--cysteine ligase CoaBC [Acidimicrobiia bacterium]|jgi:phosphopantothenoylcysteine decarboxylase/phosphopantothenate--cysteine ligase
MPLSRRRILLGVTGGIAAYKSAYLARRLIESGADVRVVMTDAATDFLGTATMAGITGHPVTTDFSADDWTVSPHTDLARWADLIVVAPATTATIARLANGLSEDVLVATITAATGPVVVAPAMHTEMWEYPATQRNIRRLADDGVIIVGPTSGDLAGGDVGSGRMEEPEVIVDAIVAALSSSLSGVSVLVTAGGTREPIDPVRYIGNRSSGKMGHAIANEAAARGAKVTVVTTSGIDLDRRIEVVRVETAQQMADAVASMSPDVAVMAAAVADFRPAHVSSGKLVRADGPPDLELEPNPDILMTVSQRAVRPFLVGFAAESGSLDRSVEKAVKKGVDLLVANDVSQPGSGFATDTNQVTIVEPDGSTDPWPMMAKTEVASRLWDLVEQRLPTR